MMTVATLAVGCLGKGCDGEDLCCWQKTRRMMTVATLAVGCLGKVVVLALCFCV